MSISGRVVKGEANADKGGCQWSTFESIKKLKRIEATALRLEIAAQGTNAGSALMSQRRMPTGSLMTVLPLRPEACLKIAPSTYSLTRAYSARGTEGKPR